MKKILFVLGSYYPYPSANGICCGNIIKSLIEAGNEVYCVSYEQEGAKSGESFGGAEVYRVPQMLHKKLYDKYLKTKKPVFRRLYMLANYLRLLCFAAFFPIETPIGVRRYKKEVSRLIKRKGIDIVVGVNKPADAALAASRAAEGSDAKLVIYNLDPLYGTWGHPLLSKKQVKACSLKLERKILSRADLVISQEEHQSHYEKYYENNLLNKIKYLGAPLLLKPEESFYGEKTGMVLYAGAVYEETRNPQYIMEVFRYVKSAKLVMHVNIGLRLAEKLAEGNPNVKVYEAVPHEEILRLMQSAGAFLNIGNSQKLLAPSKIIQYISYGKPIISTYRTDNDSSEKYMKKYGSGLSLDERSLSPKEAARRIDALLEKSEERMNFETLRESFYECTPEAAAQLINGV